MVKKQVLWLTETAAMLALLIALQYLTSFIPKPFGQYITGSCVNTILAVTALFCGLGSGIAVAVISPIFAYLFGIAPQILVVPVIMLGNSAFVLLLFFLCKGKHLKELAGMVIAAVGKFTIQYVLVAYGICGLLSQNLIASGLLKVPAMAVLTTSFGFRQLLTAIIGGSMALLIVPLLKKALHRN